MASARTRRYYLACLGARGAALAAVLWYALARPEPFLRDLAGGFRLTPLTAVYLLLMASMLARLFPSRLESLGCQKLFARRCRPTGAAPTGKEIRQADRGALWVLLVWAAANAVIFALASRLGADGRFFVCLAGFYGVCDIVCILFFCPFQSWLMHNRCCTTCRIYDWDYLMLCTPLLGLPGWMPRSACLLAAAIFLRWEIVYRTRPERFFESGSDALRCANCTEQLCRYKRRLERLARR